MPELRRTRRWDEVMTTLAARNTSIGARSRALLDGAAALRTLMPPAGTASREAVVGTQA